MKRHERVLGKTSIEVSPLSTSTLPFPSVLLEVLVFEEDILPGFGGQPKRAGGCPWTKSSWWGLWIVVSNWAISPQGLCPGLLLFQMGLPLCQHGLLLLLTLPFWATL